VSASRSVLVTGATGSIGLQLVADLIVRGFRTRALIRHLSRAEALPRAVEVVEGGLEDVDAVRRATTDVDVVFHLAAKLHVGNPDESERGAYRRVNVDGTRNLVAAAQRAGVARFVFFSTIAVYGPSRRGQTLDETSPQAPDSWYAETKAEAEQVVLSTFPAVVLRLAAVYGPEMKGNYPRLVRALARGIFMPIGDGTNCRTVVHENDVIAAALLAAEHPEARGRIFNVTDGSVHTLRAIIAAVCTAQGRHPPRAYLPVSLARAAAGIVEDSCRLIGRRSPVGRVTIEKLVENVAVSGDLIQRELGFLPRVSLSNGWNETIATMRRNGATI